MGNTGIYVGNYQIGNQTTISKAIPIKYLIELINKEENNE